MEVLGIGIRKAAEHTLSGGVTVTLYKHNNEEPCLETILYSIPEITAESIRSICKFHRAFCLSRNISSWAHRFIMIYDVRSCNIERDCVSRMAEFITLHQDHGDFYLEKLFGVGVIMSHEETKNILNTSLLLFEPVRPVVPFLEGSSHGNIIVDIQRQVAAKGGLK